MTRVISWFSCGIASAVTAKLMVDKYGDSCEVVYCDTFAYEHPDNRRFFIDVEQWIDRKIKIIKSNEYKDIYDVFTKTKWLVGPKGARCTTELKKVPRKLYQRIDDIHGFGFTIEEPKRIVNFANENPELSVDFPLFNKGWSKRDCRNELSNAGIELPIMYKMGYKNNNCLGCVKGGMGYWNKIRVDFPDIFQQMAKTERSLGVAICKTYKDGKRIKVFLDELPPDAGRYESEPDFECGILCS